MDPQDADDWDVYDLAEQISSGMPRSETAHREVARELMKLREEVRLIRLMIHADDIERATCAIDTVAARIRLL